MNLKCVFCKNEYLIDNSDPQYKTTKNNSTKSFVCKKCNNSIQSDARRNVDFNSELVDPYKFDKLIP